MQIHGKVLTHLQARCQDEYFCFMDSDIFATDYLPNLLEIIKQENLTGLFSAMPLWVKKSEYFFKRDFRSMLGVFNQMKYETCIGSTYFAIYNNDSLRQIIQHYNICFDENPRKSLSTEIQRELDKLGYSQTYFDTGKVINLLLNKHKFRLKNIEIPELCHIGGTSYETTYQNQPINKKQAIKKWLLRTPIRSFIQKNEELQLKKRYKNAPVEEYQINHRQRLLHRNSTRQHFLTLFLALKEVLPLPPNPIFEDEEITTNVAYASKLYIENFRKYYNKE